MNKEKTLLCHVSFPSFPLSYRTTDSYFHFFGPPPCSRNSITSFGGDGKDTSSQLDPSATLVLIKDEELIFSCNSSGGSAVGGFVDRNCFILW